MASLVRITVALLGYRVGTCMLPLDGLSFSVGYEVRSNTFD